MNLTIIRNGSESTIPVNSIEEMQEAANTLKSKGAFELVGKNDKGVVVYWNNFLPNTRANDKVWRM